PEAAGNAQPHLPECAADALFDFLDRQTLERPLSARDDNTRVGFTHPPGEDSVRLALRRRRVAAVALAARERHRLGRGVGHHLVSDDTADRLAVLAGDGRLEEHPVVAGEQFADPAAPDDRITAAEQEAVAGIALGRRVVAAPAAVEEPEGQFVAAIVDVVEDGTIPLRRVLRSKEEDIGLELDLAVGVPRRQVEIDDKAVARVLRIDREAGDADDLLVRAGVAERLAAGERLALENGERHQRGPCLGGAEEEGQDDRQRASGERTRSVTHVGVLFLVRVLEGGRKSADGNDEEGTRADFPAVPARRPSRGFNPSCKLYREARARAVLTDPEEANNPLPRKLL